MRRMMMVATLLIAVPAVACGASYQWRDDAGVLHFTDDSDRIPDKYLKRAREADSMAPQKPPEAAARKPAGPAAAPAAGQSYAAPVAVDPARRARLAAELKRVRAGLPIKKKELERLQHKWNVAKGRTPTLEEAREFQKKLAEGRATDQDNPYINKNALTSAGPARAAYYKKLDEVHREQARAKELELELEALK